MREIASSHPRVHRYQSVLSGGRYGGGGEDDTDQTGKWGWGGGGVGGDKTRQNVILKKFMFKCCVSYQ